MQIKSQQVLSVSWELRLSNLQIPAPARSTFSDSSGRWWQEIDRCPFNLKRFPPLRLFWGPPQPASADL